VGDFSEDDHVAEAARSLRLLLRGARAGGRGAAVAEGRQAAAVQVAAQQLRRGEQGVRGDAQYFQRGRPARPQGQPRRRQLSRRPL